MANTPQFPEADAAKAPKARDLSSRETVDLCMDFVGRVADALPLKEGIVLTQRLEAAKKMGGLTQLALEVARDPAMVEQALGISDEEWVRKGYLTPGDRVREGLQHVLTIS